MKKTIRNIIINHKKVVEEFEKQGVETIEKITQMILTCFNRNGTVYLCGNGGSAADCQHIAGEFTGRFRKNRIPLPAVALSTDTSVITCIGNDYSYEDIFSRQVKALVTGDDLLWAFSTSGNSPNIVAAAQKAKEKGAVVVGFTGRPDSALEKMADVCLCANTPTTSHAQEIHQLAYHTICELIDLKY